MRNFQRIVIGIVLLIIAYWLLSDSFKGKLEGKPPLYGPSRLIFEDTSKPVVFVGDTQIAGSLEKTFLGRENNVGALSAIANAIFEINPALVVHLGDIVFDCESPEDWKVFDQAYSKFSGNIPIAPVAGNHEYWTSVIEELVPSLARDFRLQDNKGQPRELSARFPVFNRTTWYSGEFGPVGFIWLDSNEPRLSEESKRQQVKFLESTLEKFQEDSKIKAVVLMTHHPPFTNSDVVGKDSGGKLVRNSILPTMNKLRKPYIFFSGHAHGYERFNKEGRNFVVSAGGGGPRQGLEGKPIHTDKFPLQNSDKEKRYFNFVAMKLAKSGLEFSVLGFNRPDQDSFEIIDRFQVLWSATN